MTSISEDGFAVGTSSFSTLEPFPDASSPAPPAVVDPEPFFFFDFAEFFFDAVPPPILTDAAPEIQFPSPRLEINKDARNTPNVSKQPLEFPIFANCNARLNKAVRT
eukprot:CAMPEP_0171363948 /NCGR_PEP_ID=MMETSP0879-20121228/3707_1 /TAXON_ID=67004 /ORGANISM="Thalassiosira weissflogii, Strain CCMP1336" /LENGTH=106 /DNA_ID=CAMNT_0011871211 /DNA_START=42 /DNA_END=358 /DNA_ORIENTATION=-